MVEETETLIRRAQMHQMDPMLTDSERGRVLSQDVSDLVERLMRFIESARRMEDTLGIGPGSNLPRGRRLHVLPGPGRLRK